MKILSDNKLIRPSGRSFDELRKIEFIPNFISHAEGSCFVKYGETHVLCTASVEERVPIFLKNSGKGWVTANMVCYPDLLIQGVDVKLQGANKVEEP